MKMRRFDNNPCVKKPSQNNIEQRLLEQELKFDPVGEQAALFEEDVNRQIVVVCFGTMAISGDSLGPTVGTLLKEKYGVPAFVYGTENAPVNGKNMQEWLTFIRAAHKDALFLSVDASLGGADRVGQIIVRDDGVCPAAIKGKNSRFGDIGILAVVAENKGDALMQLMAVPALYVAELADKVANLVSRVFSA